MRRAAQLTMFGAGLFLVYHVLVGRSISSDLKGSSEGISGQKCRVMTFNTWIHGHNVKDGLEKLAKHILAVDPDAVLLQEIQAVHELDDLLELLGSPWNAALRGGSRYVDDAMNMDNSFSIAAGVGVEIRPTNDSTPFRVVGLHLDWKNMGTYATYNKLVTDMRQIMVGEETPPIFNRVYQIKELLHHDVFVKWVAEADEIPVFVGGDFNSASHLDWTERRKSEHGGWAVEWPSTKLMAEAGFSDSFRVRHPDPVEVPGDTWSTIQKHNLEWNWTVPEPQDRIDFIFFKGSQVHVQDSQIYSGSDKPRIMPNHFENDYPSDHFAVVSDFILQ